MTRMASTCRFCVRQSLTTKSVASVGFRVLDVIGKGGMGVVFRAEDLSLKRMVALKVMKPTVSDTPEYVERFLREAQAAAALTHDNIIPIHSVGEDNGVPFLVMPLLDGESLADRLVREAVISINDVFVIAKQVAAGLDAAHAAGLLHRDIKPENLWIESEGRVRILDFGLARVMDDSGSLTTTGSVIGTPRYMSPEQAEAQSVDARSDLFSLGAVIYRMLAGRSPFDRGSITATLTAIATDEPESITSVNPETPKPLAALVHQLLAKKPEGRVQSAGELMTELDRVEQITGTKRSRSMLSNPVLWCVCVLTLLASVSLPGVLFKMQTPLGTIVIECDEGELLGAEISVDGEHRLTISTEKDIEPIMVEADRNTHELSVTKGGFRTFTDRFTVSAGEHQTISVRLQPIVPTDTEKPSQSAMQTIPQFPCDFAWHGNRKDLLVASRDGTFWLIDGTTGKIRSRTELLQYRDSDYRSQIIAPKTAGAAWLSKRDAFFVGYYKDERIQLLGDNLQIIQTIELRNSPDGSPSNLMALESSPDGQLVAAATPWLTIFDSNGVIQKENLSLGASHGIEYLTWTNDGNQLMCHCFGTPSASSIQLFNLETNEFTSIDFDTEVESIDIDRNTNRAVIARNTNDPLVAVIDILDISTKMVGNSIQVQMVGSDSGQTGIGPVLFSPDGKLLAVQVDAGVRILTHDGELLATFQTGSIGAWIWSPDGGQLVAYPRQRGFVELDVASRKILPFKIVESDAKAK